MTDARTLENSEVGDMTKLSLLLDQDIRCWMVESSSILLKLSANHGDMRAWAPPKKVLTCIACG